MARALPLGLSVAPWPVETSTAHDDSSLWETVISSGIVMSFWYFLSASDIDLSLVPPSLQPPEKRASHQLSLTSPVSRRLYRPPESTKTNLGFLLAGLNPNLGPLTLLKPMSIRCNPNLQSPNLRSVSTLLLYFCSQWLDRFYDLNGIGHHLRDKSLSLLWIYIHYLRTLTLVSPKALIIVSKSLKSYKFVFMNRVCRRFVCGHGGPWFNFYSATSLSNVFNHCPNTIIFKTRILCSQDKYALHMSDPEPLLYFIKRPSSDYKSIVFRTRADTLLRVDLLKPTRSSAVALSSTSPCLLTVTILSSIDSFVEDLSTNRDLTCAKSLSCICLKALMEPLLICFIYPFVALGNVLHYVLNFGSLIPSSLCIWFFLD